MEPEYNRPVTMRDVAGRAGVNVSTVSRALRGDPRVSEATLAKVREAADAMEYRPNPYVQAFTAHVRGYRRMPEHAPVALLNLYDPRNMPSYTRLYAEGVEAQARLNGFKVDSFKLDGSSRQFDRLLRILQTRGIQGLVVLPVEKGSVLAGLEVFPLAMATIDYTLKFPRLHRATPCYFQNMDLALRRAHCLGYRRMGFFTFREEVDRISPHWLGSFASWSMLQPPSDQVKVHFSQFNGEFRSGSRAERDWKQYRRDFLRWVEDERPEVILSNDTFSLEWLRSAGLDVPGDIGFIHLGLNEEEPGLSGIDQNHREIGAAAMDLVLSQIHANQSGVPAHMKTVLVYGRWVEGSTTRGQD